MSLFKLDISKTTGRGTHLFGTATEILYNGEGVYGLTRDGGALQSKFFYNLNVKNDKVGVVRVEADHAVSSIQSSINEDFLEKFITLTVYKDAVSTSDTENYTILSKNICFAYDVDMGAVVYIRQGVKLKRIITVESIDNILSETMLPWPGGITITEAFTSTADDSLVRMRFDDQIDITTISGDSALHIVLQVWINGTEQDLTSSSYYASLGGEYISFYMPTDAVYGDSIEISYTYNKGGGWGWNDGGVLYLENFEMFVTNNAEQVTTTTTSTSSTSTTSTSSTTSTTSTSSTSTSSTSTSSTSTSSTSTSSTSTSSTSSTSTSTTSTSSTSTTSTTTTTLDDEEIWTDGTDTFRFIARDSHACLDQTLTPTGFAGTEGVDWANVWKKTAIPSNAKLYESGYPQMWEEGGFKLNEE